MAKSKNKRKNGKTKKFNPNSKLGYRIGGHDVYTQADVDRNDRLAQIREVSRLRIK